MRRIIEIDDPDWTSIVGVDADDERSYLLATPDGALTRALLLGPEQVAMLADRLSAMIDELERRGLAAIETNGHGVAAPPAEADDVFIGQTLLVGWDDERDRFVMEAWAPTEPDGAGESAHGRDDDIDVDISDDDPDGPDVLRIRVDLARAQRLTRRAFEVLAADRPDCPLCGAPLSPARHRCAPIEDATRDA